MKNIILSNISNKPIYLQLYEQISSQIFKGELKPGVNLPSLRLTAKELRVSIITVKKAWEELEKNGFIYTIAGKGCFVSENSNTSLESKKKAFLKEQLIKDLKYYKKLDVSKELLVEMINDLYDSK